MNPKGRSILNSMLALFLTMVAHGATRGSYTAGGGWRGCGRWGRFVSAPKRRASGLDWNTCESGLIGGSNVLWRVKRKEKSQLTESQLRISRKISWKKWLLRSILEEQQGFNRQRWCEGQCLEGGGDGWGEWEGLAGPGKGYMSVTEFVEYARQLQKLRLQRN